jgi:tRNA-Thr(GGU) m(6)t(6)A37 methyltransferase TsaA
MFKSIGVVHSPFKTKDDIPSKKYAYAQGFNSVTGELELFKEYKRGLDDIEGFSHIIVLFIFHESEGFRLHTKPLLGKKLRGVFSTRSPRRPNAIGLTVVKVLERKGNVLKVAGIDMLDGTPILDIKPYTSRDMKPEASFGWLEEVMKKEKNTPQKNYTPPKGEHE